jgi:hypothetical protein
MYSKRSRDGTFMVKNGNATAFHPPPTKDAIYENPAQAPNAPSNNLTGRISGVTLPSSVT